MKAKKITSFILLASLAMTATFGTASVASADCSHNGYESSNGKCSVSYKDGRDRDDDKSYKNNWYSNNNGNPMRARTGNFGFNDNAILALIARLQEMIKLLQSRLDNDSAISEVSVTTQSATDIDDNSATLRGKLRLNDADEADVYFEYGKVRSNLTEETGHSTLEDDASSFSFTQNIDSLTDDTIYYFRAVAEDGDGDTAYGSIMSFRTDADEDSFDEPTLNTQTATNVDTDSAELLGTVDMNDFDNGQVFFVYGEDESAVSDVQTDYDLYSDIDEDGDKLQKVLVDSDLDTAGSFQQDVGGLNDNTTIYNAICVEYENEDDETVLTCSDTKSFKTNAD